MHKPLAIARLLVARTRLEHTFVAAVALCNALQMHEAEMVLNGGLTLLALVCIILEIRSEI